MRKPKTSRKFKYLILLGMIYSILTGFLCEKPFTGKYEARGAWLTRWEYTVNLPESTPEMQQKKILEMMYLARQAKLNFVFFQVRGQCDAYYRSQYEPWAAELSGTLGLDPGWDPLKFAIEAAHNNGLELHAWLNTFVCWTNETPPPHSSPEHLFHAHPDWFCVDKSGQPMQLNQHYIFLSPGIPAVQTHVQKVALDLVQNYDIDGIHFDYIRYPENSNQLGYSHDLVSVKRFQSEADNPKKLSWEDWQRDQLNQFMRNFHDEATAAKPMLKISAAVLGRLDTTQASAYYAVFQDGLRWLREEKVDFLTPMIYWQRNHPVAPFNQMLANWLNTNQSRRPIFPGLGAYKYNQPDWPADEIKQQVASLRQAGAPGLVMFSYAALKEILTIGNYRFNYPAIFPPLPWKDRVPPEPPRNLQIKQLDHTKAIIQWSASAKAPDGDSASRYIIYRTRNAIFDAKDARNILAITTGSETEFIDETVETGPDYFYMISALDKNNNESTHSNVLTIRIPATVTLK